MKQLTDKIFIDETLFNNEHSFYFGARRGEKVNLTFSNINGKDVTKNGLFTYREALEVATRRARDGRYRNFEYLITLSNGTK